MKFLIFANGPGETGQAFALAQYLIEKREKVLFAIRLKANYKFTKSLQCPVFLTETPKKLEGIIKSEKPDVLILCNSKSFWGQGNFNKIPPSPKPLTITIDSNWLFNDQAHFPFTIWADKFLINLPPEVFKLGLKKKGGNFSIPENIMKKIEPIGLIPSYQEKPSLKQKQEIRKKYNIKKGEKFIFVYYSGFGAEIRPWVLINIISTINKLRKKGKRIKVVHLGNSKHLTALRKRNWLIPEEAIDAKAFYLVLASSDLVFQHQGLGTLAQAISAKVPVITNVGIQLKSTYPRLHPWEVGPFAKLNLCKMFYKTTPIGKIEKGIEELLFDKKEIEKMKKAQKKHYVPGEARAYQIIMDLLKDKRP